MPNAAILLTAGKGKRMEGKVHDKILAPICNRPTFLYSLRAFTESRAVEQIVIVYRDDPQRRRLAELISNADTTGINLIWTQGGKERQDSVYNGLLFIDELIEFVFIHDCARPLVTPASIRALADLVSRNKAVCLAHRATDTWKQIDPSCGKQAPDRRHLHSDRTGDSLEPRTARGELTDLNRSSIWAMETPQAFDRKLIIEAYQTIRRQGLMVMDDTAAVSHLNHPVTLLENDSPNPKLTTLADLEYIEFLVRKGRRNG